MTDPIQPHNASVGSLFRGRAGVSVDVDSAKLNALRVFDASFTDVSSRSAVRDQPREDVTRFTRSNNALSKSQPLTYSFATAATGASFSALNNQPTVTTPTAEPSPERSTILDNTESDAIGAFKFVQSNGETRQSLYQQIDFYA